jgi:hypothetical protein
MMKGKEIEKERRMVKENTKKKKKECEKEKAKRIRERNIRN